MASKKTVLITGCSEGGLGDALARSFHERGFRVVATARNPTKMAHFANMGIETVTLDVQSKESIDTAVQQVSNLTGGSLDILVNNSGVGYQIPVSDTDMSKMRNLFDVNVFSCVMVFQAFLPLLMKAAPGSMVVNQTSVASKIALPTGGLYSATKAAMSLINDAMRVELEPFGIKVVELKTGSVKTRFFENHQQNTSSKLPSTTYYELARDVLEANMNGKELVVGAQDADVWAKKVVADLLRSNPPTAIWKGTGATLVWFVSKFLPQFMVDGQARKMGGIDVFAERLHTQKKQM